MDNATWWNEDLQRAIPINKLADKMSEWATVLILK